MDCITNHQAYILKNIVTNTDLNITSITGNAKLLIAGTHQGFLISQSLSGSDANIQGIKIQKSCSKKPIQQLEIVDELDVLLCLTENYVFVYNLKEHYFLNLMQQLTSTKGASLFAANVAKADNGQSIPQVLLCVAVKKTLFVYSWKEVGFVEHRNEVNSSSPGAKKIEIPLKDIPKVLTWFQQNIFIGFKNEYLAVDLNGNKTDLFPTGSSKNSDPCMFRVNYDYMVLNQDNHSTFIKPKLDMDSEKAIHWADTPLAIVYDEPFYIALLSSSNIEIQTLEYPKQVQVFLSKESQRLRFLCHCGTGVILVASNTKIWSLTRVGLLKQREDLLKSKYYQLAITITEMTNEEQSEKELKIKKIRTIFGYDLFNKKQYAQSMKEFIGSDTDPYLIIELYPKLLEKSPDSFSIDNVDVEDREDYKNSLIALVDYLSSVRQKIKVKSFSESTNDKDGTKMISNLLQIIDTTLLKCYLETNNSFVAPLIRLKQCNFGETERILTFYGKFREMIVLYETRGQHHKALELLKNHVHNPESPINGYDHIIQYLQNLGNDYLNLIFEFGDWILKSNSKKGLRIFMADLEDVENLPRDKVLDFFEKKHEPLVTTYLEHIIHNWKEEKPIFHNQLVLSYKNRIQTLDDQSENDEKRLLQMKFREFLTTSKYYLAEFALKIMPDDGMLEERAIILSKLSKFEEALRIYLFQLRDQNKAIEYCIRVYDDQTPGYRNIFIVFLKLLLEEIRTFDYKYIGDVIDRFTLKIPPIEMLEILPDDFPLELLTNYMELTLCDIRAKKFHLEMSNGLLAAEYLRLQEQKLLLQQKSVLLTDSVFCSICKKKFINRSKFVRYPNGDVVHYSCHELK